MLIDIKKNTLIIFDFGEYSDKDYLGPFVVLKDYSEAEVTSVFLKAYKEDHRYGPSPTEFVNWLVANEYIESVDCLNRYIGSCFLAPKEFC